MNVIKFVGQQLERRDPTIDENDVDDEDIEMANLSDGEYDDEEDEEDDSDQTSDQEQDGEDDEEEVDEDAALALRNKIEQALRVNGIEPPTGDSESEEDLMDDEQMMAIDGQLAEVFRSHISENKSGKGALVSCKNILLIILKYLGTDDAQREATHFKIRVLDLVDIFVKKQSSDPLILRFITPLVEIVINTGSDEQQLSEKTKGILSNRLAPKLGQLPSNVSQSELAKSYLDVHNYARRVHDSGLQTALKSCSLHLTKRLLNAGAVDVVTNTYRASLTDFFTRKNSALQPAFFEDFFRQNRSIGWELRQDVLEGSSKALNGYRQCQAFQFLHLLLPAVSTMVRTNAVSSTQTPLICLTVQPKN